MTTALAEQREVERKVRVPDDFSLPALDTPMGPAQVTPEEPLLLCAAYHDTPDLRLIRWGVTLRRREGGTDAGWHLKLPVAGAEPGIRDEVHLPLDSGPVGQVPAELAHIVAPLVREAPLRHIATLQTRRTPAWLATSAGERVAELADDRVRVLAGESATAGFREIEVEVVPDPPMESDQVGELLSEVVATLVAAGGQSSATSKLAIALGASALNPPDIVVPEWPARSGRAGDAVHVMVATCAREFLLQDVRLRRQLPDSAHQLRVSARTLRSVLRTFAPVFEPAWAQELSDALKSAAGAVADTRDLEVHAARLLGDLGSLPAQERDALSELLAPRLAERQARAQEQVTAMLNSPEHARLLIDLVQAARTPRLVAPAREPAGKLLAARVDRAAKRLTAAAADLDPAAPAQQWHRVRILAKRARYAAKLSAPVLGGRTRRWAKTLSEVTDLLGDQQDAQVARSLLADLAREGDWPSDAAFGLGLLDELQVERARVDRERFLERWPDARAAHGKRPTRGH